MIIIGYLSFIILALYFMLISPTKWLKVEKIKYELGLDIKVLQISDMHIKNLRVDLKKLLEMLKNLRKKLLL